MLHALREWLTAVVSVSLLLSLLRALTPSGSMRSASSFAGGLALAAVLLRPLAGKTLAFPAWDGASYRAELSAEQAASEAAWRETVSEAVCTRTEAAVRRKAAELGTDRTVRVEVQTAAASGTETAAEIGTAAEALETGGVPLPWTVTLSGERDAGLETWIADALGIPPERQRWTGQHNPQNWTG